MHCISCSDLMGPGWRFLADQTDAPALSWSTHSGLPRDALERLVKRPNLARYRAAWTAVAEARHRRDDALLVSHLPLMAAAANTLRRQRAGDVPQIAFAFNFTERPDGARLRYLRGALRGIEEFVVFSRFEQQEYPALFDLDPGRFRFLPWAMEAPVPGTVQQALPAAPYLCAIGGEGRDYALLAEAMRQLPGLGLIVVARPHSVAGIDFPDNVQVFTNLPLGETWRIAADSAGLVIPLLSPDTACGHITLVGAQMLGIPLVITASVGVADYVADGTTARVVPARDLAALRKALTELRDDPDGARARAAAAADKALAQNTPAQWVTYFQDKQAALQR